MSHRTLITLLLLTSHSVAAPVPKADPAQKVKAMFGEVADPTSDTKCEPTKTGALRVTVPKESRALELTHGFIAAPVTTKTVEGDFVLTVRLSHAPPASADRAEGAKQQATAAAGIALYSEGDAKVNATFVHTYSTKVDKWAGGLSMQTNYRQGSTSSSGGNPPGVGEKPLYLRLTRKGDVLIAETSADGKKWAMFTRHPADKLGPVVVVGPTVFRNTASDHAATFDEYEIKPPAEEKK